MSPKVLIVAENASASVGGEAFIALQYFRFFRETGVDVHLLVHERCQNELHKLLPSQIERVHFIRDSHINVWCDKIAELMRNGRLAFFTVRAISRIDTQIRQRRLIPLLVKDHQFNIIHEPTPVSPKLPSIMFGMSVPVVIGPLNGGMNFPPNYSRGCKFETGVLFILKLSSTLWNAVLPGKLHAALLLVANKRTQNALPLNLKGKRVLEIVENGVDLELFRPAPRSEAHGSIGIVYVGALRDWKRVDLLLAACANVVGKANFHLDVVGDGPERGALEIRCEQLSLTSQVQFRGHLSHAAVAELLRSSDIMVHPAMRECGGAVILEAMASGIPVIAADWGGPSEYIDESSGILIPPATPEQFVVQLANAILSLSENSQLRKELGKGGRRRVEELYDWRLKAKAMLEAYRDILGEVAKSAAVEPGEDEAMALQARPVGVTRTVSDLGRTF